MRWYFDRNVYSLILCWLFLSGVSGAESTQANRHSGPETPVTLVGCENVFRIQEQLYSGGEPKTRDSFKVLKAMGVKTLVSVDGSTPKVDPAREFGMRYVHLPIGYSAIEDQRSLELGRVLRDSTEPIYIHCHHGKHRGPAAAAMAMLATTKWDNTTAVAFLRQAGTSENYAGLYNSIQEFKLESPHALDQFSGTFPEIAPCSTMAQAMASIDRIYDHLVWSAKADFNALEHHPDIDPSHEALMLYEAFHELLRNGTGPEWSGPFRSRMEKSEALSRSLKEAIPDDAEAAQTLLTTLRNECTACHKAYRD